MRFSLSLVLLFLCLCLGIPDIGYAAPATKKTTTIKKQTATKSKSKSRAQKRPVKRSKTAQKKKRSKSKTKSPQTQTANRPRLNEYGVAGNDVPTASAGHLAGNADQSMVPVSVRGQGINLGRVVEACLYANNNWTLPNQTPADVEEQLALLAPTFVTGAAHFQAGTLPNQEQVSSWNALRSRLQEVNSTVGFDIVLDLSTHSSPDEVVIHMRRLASQLAAEAWTFSNPSRAIATNPEVLSAAMAEAKQQGRFIGFILSRDYIPSELDYAIVTTGNDGSYLTTQGSPIIKKLQAKRAASLDGTVRILGVSSGSKYPGESFAQGRTPAQRRKTVIQAARKQSPTVAYAYPVFGPLNKQAKAYDATRDEFMLDTIRRNMVKHNPVSNPSSIAIGAME